ncbi:pentatricopeptide repeat-containing protein At4g16470 isoform X1 [Rhododendron vialii]|uniref:pentatricopeptide repeat-containing protein At4g16470 isoform X1 n=1 Tax=Rhododendron vialii TaxID=182163 RepID=UPI00265FD879|nr:pentatricopeptide repeat-containing protein At4g16470 isoform X1 [Rhododendron vialii]XP_058196870.1 pentatricopeptide repeat-containing protein At4g16470 isoform X1 [Rhododendron vialii]
MLTLSRMKALLSPTLSSAHPTRHLLFHFKPLQNPNSFQVKAALPSNSIKALNLHTEASQSPCGEIHVIVGPMFAGKTSTLLRRIKSESSNGSFQVKVLENSTHLDRTLRGHCFSGRLDEAVRLVCSAGTQVYPETYSLLLQECIFRKQYRLGRRIHAQMAVVGFVPNVYLITKLLILYAKAGDLETASILFNELPETSLISWNAIIAGYVQKGLVEIGLGLYYKMRDSGVGPDQYTFASVFRACATLATLEQGKQAHGIFIKSHIIGNVVVNSALMDMYFKCSCPSDGRLVFDKSEDRNVITWTSLISGYGQNGSTKEVLQSFQRMINEGYRPNYVTFLAVLSACSHGGLVSEGWEYFSSMRRDYGIQPRGKHYAAMVDLLGRSGRLQEAFDFVQTSPYQEHSVIWGALVGACRIHGNMDMVKLSAKKFFELEQENAGKYVVLCNAYATYGLWDSVAEMRGQMKEFGMKKEPGYSMIEVQREAHFFFMSDNSHEQTVQLQDLVNDLTCILKDAGYVPDLSSWWE